MYKVENYNNLSITETFAIKQHKKKQITIQSISFTTFLTFVI